MAFNLVPTTLLAAVNELLTAVGTTPVNTLTTSGLTDAAIAQDVIESISREVQSRGWWFNTVKGLPLVPAGAIIAVPANMLQVRPALKNTTIPGETAHFVQREGKLYDILNNTYSWVSQVRVDAVMLFDFEQLPESVRRYITVRAARIFQTKVLGDEQLGVFTQEHEIEAWQILEADHSNSGPSTIFLDNVKRRFRANRDTPVVIGKGQQQPQGR
jgi:hypothetical protein